MKKETERNTDIVYEVRTPDTQEVSEISAYTTL
jgi:hypothetical protein